MRWRRARLLPIACCVWLVGAPLAAGELIISVAASLHPAVEEVAALHRAAHPDVEVAIGTGASGVLMQQILRGAPVDLYVSASRSELDRLGSEALLVDGTRRDVASNRLVVLSALDAAPLRSVDELIRDATGRVALGNPDTAPLGRYTRQALQTLGLADSLHDRLIPAESARQVVTWVARGEVTAGLGYRTDALRFSDRVRLGPELPVEAHDPIVYQAAVIAGSDAADQALAFLDLLLSPKGLEVLTRHGFLPPP